MSERSLILWGKRVPAWSYTGTVFAQKLAWITTKLGPLGPGHFLLRRSVALVLLAPDGWSVTGQALVPVPGSPGGAAG